MQQYETDILDSLNTFSWGPTSIYSRKALAEFFTTPMDTQVLATAHSFWIPETKVA
jgi:hypothetical protein